MQFFEKNILSIFFIGIGGTGNSALASYLNGLDFSVSGSDVNKTDITIDLEKKGIKVFYEHCAENLKNVDLVVYSSAIDKDNPELKFALENKYAVYSRAELLSLIEKRFEVSIGVAGSHGKTTTTALIANIMKEAKLPFTAFMGGYDKNLTNVCSFGNKIFLAEICEYKRNIDLFSSTISVVLNIDNDHLECYNNSLEELTASFESFSKRSDKRIVNSAAEIQKSNNTITFGIKNGSYHAEKIKSKKGRLKFKVYKGNKKIFSVKAELLGEHHVNNALAAIAAAKQLGIKNKYIKRGIANFRGVLRRNEYLGSLNGSKVFADYAHHPKEIEKTISSYIHSYSGRVIFVFEPHTYSRTKALFNDFINVFKDLKFFFLYKTYAAREDYDVGGDAMTLSNALNNSIYEENFKDLVNDIACMSNKKDIIVILGAGELYYDFKHFLQKKSRN